jgi:hypothetical protein
MSVFGGIRLAATAAGMLGMAAGSMGPATAAPLAPTIVSITSDSPTATQVRWRGGGGGAGLAAGLATGLIIGGLLAAPRYYYEPYPYYLDDYPPRYGGPIGYGAPGWEAYCFSRYRSFDPVSGTYLGRDGRRHYCQ